MPTRSKLGTVTWIDPIFYISYDNVTGQIMVIGSPLDGYPKFQISVEQAIAFTSGQLNANDYRVVKENNIPVLVKKQENLAVDKTYPIKIVSSLFPNLKIKRNKQDKNWKIIKQTTEPVFLFVCKTNSSRHYIRTLNIIEQEITIPMIYDTEAESVDLYVQEQYSLVEFTDE